MDYTFLADLHPRGFPARSPRIPVGERKVVGEAVLEKHQIASSSRGFEVALERHHVVLLWLQWS